MEKRSAEGESFRLAHNLRNRLRSAPIRQLAHKTSKTDDLFGISFEEFKDYIEFLMSAEMTWKNIDHIHPLSSFNLTNRDQLKQAPFLQHSATFKAR